MKKYYLIFSTIVLLILTLTGFKKSNRFEQKFAGQQTALHTEHIQLNDNESLKPRFYRNQHCLNLSNINLKKPSILIRTMETNVLYSDLQKIGLERIGNVGNNTISLMLSDCFYYNKYTNGNARTSLIDYKDGFDPQSDGSCFCEYKPIEFSEQAWSKSSYDNNKEVDITSDKFRSLYRKIIMSDMAFSWVMNDIIEMYKQASTEYPDDWKKTLVYQLGELEVFLSNFNKNLPSYNTIARNPKLFMPSEIGANQAFLYRRMVNDGLSQKNAAVLISSFKNTIKNSIGNGQYSHFRDYNINNGNFVISIKFVDDSSFDYIFLKAKGSVNEIKLRVDEVNYVKCMKEAGKDYLYISNAYNNAPTTNMPYKQLLISQTGNIELNTY